MTERLFLDDSTQRTMQARVLAALSAEPETVAV